MDKAGDGVILRVQFVNFLGMNIGLLSGVPHVSWRFNTLVGEIGVGAVPEIH
jgi:hypothetical protein